MQSSVRDLGIRTIGWGSVATIAWIALLMAGCGQASAAAPAPTATVAMTMPTPAQSETSIEVTPVAVTPVATTSVRVESFAFSPAVITVPVGETVTWTNQDIEEHTVTARDRSFGSDAIENGKAFQFTFSKAGTYEYYCAIHPEMVGRVIVRP